MATLRAYRDVRRCFDSEQYLQIQTREILGRMEQAPKTGSVYVEFGGKAYDDQHAARVLPGYDPHLKIRLLKNLAPSFEVAVVVSARDILRVRLRGDSQLFYDRETVRLITRLRDAGVSVNHGVVSMTRDDYMPRDRERLDEFLEAARTELGVVFVEHGFIDGYPSVEIFDRGDGFARNPKIEVGQRNLLVLSPGGGSGKFGVCLSQLVHDFRAGRNSFYLKFETFPVFQLAPNHPVNLAFVAATADLGNRVMEESSQGLTTYDKDEQNFRLLVRAVERYCPDKDQNPLSRCQLPSDMSVNKLLAGFTDEPTIRRAAIREIKRRIDRYRDEISRGIESEPTIENIRQVLPFDLQHLIE